MPTYFISDGEFVKIGRTRRPIANRLRQLQIMNARPLRVLAMHPNYFYEEKFHERFEPRRVLGEWFRITEEELRAECPDVCWAGTLDFDELANCDNLEAHRERHAATARMIFNAQKAG